MEVVHDDVQISSTHKGLENFNTKPIFLPFRSFRRKIGMRTQLHQGLELAYNYIVYKRTTCRDYN